VHRRHPAYRLVISADAPFPSGASEDDWRHTRSREASDVNAELRAVVGRDATHSSGSDFRSPKFQKAR
jgi:hypothetical protein